MKKFFLGLFLLASAAGSLSSCKDSKKIPAPAEEDLPLIFPAFLPGDTVNVFLKTSTTKPSINTRDQQHIVRPKIEFIIDPTDRDINIRTVEVYKSYGRGSNGTFAYTPRVKLDEFTSFPAKVSVDSDQILKGLTFNSGTSYLPIVPLLADGTPSLTASYTNFSNDSVILFTFEYILEDGRRIILTPLDRNGVVTGTFSNPPYALRVNTAETYHDSKNKI